MCKFFMNIFSNKNCLMLCMMQKPCNLNLSRYESRLSKINNAPPPLSRVNKLQEYQRGGYELYYTPLSVHTINN